MQYLIKNIFKMTEKKYILFFFIFSDLFNYFFRLLPREERNLSLYNPDIINLFLGLLFFSYLFFIGLQIKKFKSIKYFGSYCFIFIVFFYFDTYFLFITRYFDLVYLFFIINLLWLFHFFIWEKLELRFNLIFTCRLYV